MIPTVTQVTERLTLFHCRTDTFKAGTLSLSLVLPINPDSTYLTSLLFSVLLRGCRKYPDIASINRRLDYLYGTELSVRNFYRGDVQAIGLSANILDDAYLPRGGEDLVDAVLDLMREILFCPVLDQNGLLDARYVESEKQLQCDTIRAQKNHPHSYAADRACKILYRNDPCGTPIYGKIEEVMAVTPERLTAHWKEVLANLSLQIFYVGTAKEEILKATLERYFVPHLSASVQTPLPAPIFPVRTSDRTAVREEETQEINQGHLVLAFRTGCTLCDADFYACTLLNELLGASPVSKLFMNVREKWSLCYSCSSVYNGYKGTLLINCGLSKENRARAEEEILQQIRAIADGDVTDEEWEAAQRSLANAYRQLSDSPTAIESYYFGRSLAGVNETPDDCRARLATVLREEVVSLASRLILDTVFFLQETGTGEGEADEED